MVFASIYGSSASNAYGKGGTVNAMGESSDVKFSLNFPGQSAASKLAPNFSAPSRATPAILPATSKFLRFTKNFPGAAGRTRRFAKYTSRRLVHSTTGGKGSGTLCVSFCLDARERATGRFSNHWFTTLRET